MRYVLRSLVFSVLLFCLDLFSLELVDKEERRYNFCVCAIFKNEGRYLKEWIEYHRIVGVQHFYLYNNASTDNSMEILAPYIQEGVATVIYWPNRLKEELDDVTRALFIQIPAYENTAKYWALKEAKWLALLDVDEFIVPVNAFTVDEVLENYGGSSGLELAVDFFDASNESLFLKRKLVIQTIELTKPIEEKLEKSRERAIFKPKDYTAFTWPPYKLHFKDRQPAVSMDRKSLRINKYVNRSRGVVSFAKRKDRIQVDNRLCKNEEVRSILEVGFEIEDQERVIYRYVPSLLERMGFEKNYTW